MTKIILQPLPSRVAVESIKVEEDNRPVEIVGSSLNLNYMKLILLSDYLRTIQKLHKMKPNLIGCKM